jgi:hypothetical protein
MGASCAFDHSGLKLSLSRARSRSEMLISAKRLED